MARPRTLGHPLPLFAVAVLVANDHLLKGRGVVPGFVTGKLSDLAGLFFFPVLLVTAGRVLRVRGVSPWRAAWATVVAFSALKLVPPVHAAWVAILGPAVMDPTDLFALPCALLAARWMEGARAVPRGLGHGDRLAVLVAAIASSATSAIHLPPCKTTPETAEPAVSLDKTCLTSPGMTLRRKGTLVHGTLALGTRGGPCPIAPRMQLEVRRATLLLRTTGAFTAPPPPTVEQGMVPLEVTFTLPADVDAGCEGLVPVFRHDGRRVEIPVLSCEVGP